MKTIYVVLYPLIETVKQVK